MAATTTSSRTQVDVTAYGRPATEALAARVHAAKAGHPLDPVTVIVPSNPAGLTARRLLGSGRLGAAGLANVSFVTPFRLAELLGATELGGRRPLTNPVLAAAARAVLRTEPGPFAEVAAHQSTQAALVNLYSELSRALPGTLHRIASASERGAAVVRLVHAVAGRLGRHHDEDDLAEAAARHLADDPTAAAALGTVVWHLPDRLSPAMRALVREVLAAAPSSVVVGLTGAEDADASTRSLCAEVGVTLDPDVGVEQPRADRILSVSDPDEEVRTAIREVMALVEADVRLDRIAIFFPTPEPYARTLLEQLGAAGIPHNGPAVSRLADSVAGRTLLAALALPGLGWGRSDVMALVSAAPVRHEGRPVATGRWDGLSRHAGVVAGLDDWRAKLAGHAGELRAGVEHLEAAGDPSDRRLLRTTGDLASVEELASFVTALAAGLEALHGCSSWTERSSAARALLVALLGPEHLRLAWPDHEVEAAQRVDAALARLVVLDGIEPDPAADAFELAVAAELDVRTARVGRFGEGVLVAPLATAVGLDLDATFVLGMAEGTCPSFRHDDSLLPDDDRLLAVASELTTSSERLADQHRGFLSALAAAGGRRTIVFARGDLRDRRQRLPSRWLLDSASHHAQRKLFSSDVDTLAPPVLEAVASYADGIRRARVHGTVTDRDVAALLDHVTSGGDLASHPLAEGALGRGLLCHRSRESTAFTEWDGNVSGVVLPAAVAGVPVSPSRLETWASCPFRYFLAHVLHLSDRDDPEDVIQLAAADRGRLVHEVLERFIGDAIDRESGPPAPEAPWSLADRSRVRAIAEETFRRYEAEGLTGRPLLWRRTRSDVLDDLDAFLTRDDAHRAGDGVRPLSVEMGFGVDDRAPLSLALPDGRVVTFRGRADRVDEGADGRLVVLDYKTGKDRYTRLHVDPVTAGTALQLGVYAEAAKARHGREEVETRYWMASSRGGFVQRGYAWTEDRRERFLGVVATIVDGIESGTFPGQPGAFDTFFGSHQNCGSCDFDRVCPRNREDHQHAKADAPELSLLALLQPPVSEEERP